jgi:methyl-accepting chemotaxis protein
MEHLTQQNAALVEASNTSSHALAEETAELAKMAELFQVRQGFG